MVGTTAFISSDPGINTAISRYFKYIHKEPLITSTFNNKELPNILSPHIDRFVVQNELLINGEVCGLYPFWFAWGMKNNTAVYGFSFERTCLTGKILNWEDFLNLNWPNRSTSLIRYREIPGFDSTQPIIRGILRPHCGDSLFDLSAKLHSSFVDVSRRVKRKIISDSFLENVKTIFIEKGTRIFSEFREKEKKYHGFLSLLPGSQRLFNNIELFADSLDALNQIKVGKKISTGELTTLFRKIERNVKDIYGFFAEMEQYMKGDEQWV